MSHSKDLKTVFSYQSWVHAIAGSVVNMIFYRNLIIPRQPSKRFVIVTYLNFEFNDPGIFSIEISLNFFTPIFLNISGCRYSSLVLLPIGSNQNETAVGRTESRKKRKCIYIDSEIAKNRRSEFTLFRDCSSVSKCDALKSSIFLHISQLESPQRSKVSKCGE